MNVKYHISSGRLPKSLPDTSKGALENGAHGQAEELHAQVESLSDN
ncbi:MAG: hypothetical protein SWE60_19040 [Thermodesulfobacteriota bacterium]|nr:hypothetical protein [Thermodesulfobacteriota bacterium]